MPRYTPHRLQRRAWSPAELDQLRREYPTTTQADLAFRLGRLKCSVEAKAKQLGLQKSAGFMAARTGPKMKGRNTFSDTPAAPIGEDVDAVLAIWQDVQKRRFQNRAFTRAPAQIEHGAIQVI